MAQELSRLPAANGKETSHGDGSLPLRQVRVEGLGALLNNSVIVGARLSAPTPRLGADERRDLRSESAIDRGKRHRHSGPGT